MMLAFLALIAIYILWVLLARGFLWKLILGIGGWFGIYVFLGTYVSGAADSGITVWDTLISWAAVVPTIIVILAMAHTKEE